MENIKVTFELNEQETKFVHLVRERPGCKLDVKEVRGIDEAGREYALWTRPIAFGLIRTAGNYKWVPNTAFYASLFCNEDGNDYVFPVMTDSQYSGLYDKTIVWTQPLNSLKLSPLEDLIEGLKAKPHLNFYYSGLIDKAILELKKRTKPKEPQFIDCPDGPQICTVSPEIDYDKCPKCDINPDSLTKSCLSEGCPIWRNP